MTQKRHIPILFLVMAVVLLMSSSSQAKFPHADGVCANQFVQVQQALAKSGVLRDNAIAKQILQPPGSSSLYGCINEAMANSGALGGIYSDTGFNLAALISYPLGTPGTLQQYLIQTLGRAMMSGGGWAKEFSNSVASSLVATVTGALTGLLTNVLTSVLGSFGPLVNMALGMACNGFQNGFNFGIRDVGISAGGISLSQDDVINGNYGGAGGNVNTQLNHPTSTGIRNQAVSQLNNIKVGSGSGMLNSPITRNALCGSAVCKPRVRDITNCVNNPAGSVSGNGC